MTPKTEDEILTHYILSEGMDPENDELRIACSNTSMYALHLFQVRFNEMQVIIRKITDAYLNSLNKHL